MFKNPRVNSKGVDTTAVLGFVNTLDEVINKEQPTHIGVAFDPSGPTFRHEAYPAYKAQRDETPEAIKIGVPIIKKILKAYQIPVLEQAGFEADDVIGTLAHQADALGIDTYMMTPDKDYGQLVTEHVRMYRPGSGTKESEILGPQEVCQKYGLQRPVQVIDMLGLMGDAADNIPGCPGVGEKTASKLIAEYDSVDQLLEKTDILKGALKAKIENNKEQIAFSKYLATIKIDVPITLDMDQLKVQDINMDELKAIYEELEFRALLNKKFGVAGAPSPTPSRKAKAPKKNTDGSTQMTMFDIFDADQKREEEEAAAQQAWLSSMQTYRELNPKYTLIDTPEKRTQLLQTLRDAKEICLDTETTSTEAINARLVGFSFSVKEGEGYYVSTPQDEEETKRIVQEFREIYENTETLKIGQNLKYDLTVLHRYGIELYGPMFDTMIAHYLINPKLHHSMDAMAEHYLHYRTIHIEELIGEKMRGSQQKTMDQLAPEEVYVYACEDADITLKLKHILEKELKEHECERLFYDIEMPLMPVLAYMEHNGVCIDTEGLKEISTLYTNQMNAIEEEVHRMVGTNFNLASPKQVGEVLFDQLQITNKPKKTRTGQYVTSEEVLESLRSKHPVVGKILQHRGLKKLLGTYIDALPQLINERTGHIHTSFNQTITATGRLSSSNPNLQNIPVRDAEGKEVRKAFIPEQGHIFFSADYSQIELRIMAHLSGDKNLVEAFCSGNDIHAATAAKIFHKDISEVTKDERRKAKTANFGIIYGISAFGLSERMGVSRTEAKQLIDEYFQTYPGVKEYMQKSIDMARDKGYTETLFHRRLHLPDINSATATVRSFAERNAINAPIQGTAADIIKIAMIRIYRRMKAENMQSKMILQVHDELNFTVVPEEKERMQQIVIEEMQAACQMQVPLLADCGWGNNWLEAH